MGLEAFLACSTPTMLLRYILQNVYPTFLSTSDTHPLFVGTLNRMCISHRRRMHQTLLASCHTTCVRYMILPDVVIVQLVISQVQVFVKQTKNLRCLNFYFHDQ